MKLFSSSWELYSQLVGERFSHKSISMNIMIFYLF